MGVHKIAAAAAMISIKPTLQIAPIPSLSSPTFLQITRFAPRRTLTISCSKDGESVGDELLEAELGLQIKKLKSQIAQREDAFKKSREFLVAEVSDFKGLKPEDLKKRWRKMSDDEKWALVKGFVAEWSAHYHPLSARSVKELVEEYVGGSDQVSGHFANWFGLRNE